MCSYFEDYLTTTHTCSLFFREYKITTDATNVTGSDYPSDAHEFASVCLWNLFAQSFKFSV